MSTNASTALITGGTSGIGRAVANKLAALGIHVIVAGRDVERGKKTVAEIRASARSGPEVLPRWQTTNTSQVAPLSAIGTMAGRWIRPSMR